MNSFTLTACVLLSLAHAPTIAQTKTPTQKQVRHGDWYAKVVVDKMTDKRSCLVFNTKDKFVMFDPVGRLDISFHGRGGVAGFQYRIDNQPASAYEIAAANRDNWVSVSDIRDEFATAQRLLISGKTVLGTPIDLEYKLKGLAQAKEDAIKLCE